MSLRVGILTLELHVNYGGIVQAAALTRFLQDNGYEPVLLRKVPERRMVSNLGRAILKRIPGQDILGVRSEEQMKARHYGFIDRFIPQKTRPLQNAGQLAQAVKSKNLDAVIVGSDQVWRLAYHQDNNSMVYFLDFAKAGIKKISYAASFGTSEWPHPEKRDRVAELLERFDAVSVREQSGVQICQQTFNRQDCNLVIDPTLLVDPAFYAEAAAPAGNKSAYILTYLLDESQTRVRMAETVKAKLGSRCRIRAISTHGSAEKVLIPDWLRAFMDADFVVTDSYHGTIFAILARKNFITIGNSRRGLDRVLTLLSKLGLEERLVMDDDADNVSNLAIAPIDYAPVDTVLAALRDQSRDFLLGALDHSNSSIL